MQLLINWKHRKFTYRFLLFTVLLCAFLAGCEKSKVPVAKFTASPEMAYIGDTVRFINSSSNASEYLWKFGDGVVSDKENPIHVYKKEGTYSVILKAFGDKKTDEVSGSYVVFGPTIYDGKGILNVSLGDSKGQVDKVYSGQVIATQTICDSANYVYNSYVYYYDPGVIVVYESADSVAHISDLVAGIILVDPYQGRTTKVVKIGFTMDNVLSIYGTTDQQISTDNYLVYYYTTEGVYFEGDTPPFNIVQEIAVFQVNGATVSQNGQKHVAAEDHVQHFLILDPFRNILKCRSKQI